VPDRVVAAGTRVVLRNIAVEAFRIVEYRAAVELGQDKHLGCMLGWHRPLGYKTVAGNLVGFRIGSWNHLKEVERDRRMRIVQVKIITYGS
jgi:hypothetical protein